MWQRLLAIIRKELLSVLRDRRTRITLIGPPLIQMLVFAQAATMEVKNIELAVVDRDHGPAAFEIQQRLRGSPQFERLVPFPSVAGAGNQLEREEVIGILVLPGGFSSDLAAARPTSVQLLLDGRRSNAAQITTQYISSIVQQTGQALTPRPVAAATPRPELVIDNWFNPNLDYKWFMLPNLVGMLSLTVALIITALSVARERELGTFDQTLVSPATPFEIALGKLLPPVGVAAVQATLFLLVVTWIFGVPFRGSIGVFYAAVVVFAAACAGVGLFVSSLVHTQQQAFLGAFATVVPFVLLSGFATPIENMPAWLQFFTTINPLSHMLRIMQGLFLKDASVTSLIHPLIRLFIIALFTTTASILLFRRKAG